MQKVLRGHGGKCPHEERNALPLSEGEEGGGFPSATFPCCPKEMAGTGHCEEALLSPRNVFPAASFVFFLLLS